MPKQVPALFSYLILLIVLLSLTGLGLKASQAQTTSIIKTINLSVNDLAYDPISKRIYASLPSNAGSNGNSVATIDPVTGSVGPYIFVGSEPNKLALSDDGKYLYVGLDGVGAIRRINLITHTPDQFIQLGTDPSYGTFYPEDIEVRPGCPEEIVVSLKNTSISPRHAGVVLFVKGVKLPDTTQRHTGSNVIEFCTSPNLLFGLNNESSDFGFRQLAISQSGLKETSVYSNLFGGRDFRCNGGLVYAPDGRVFDPQTRTLQGTFSFDFPGFRYTNLVSPDVSIGRAFFLTGTDDSTVINIPVFSTTSFLRQGVIQIRNVKGDPGSLIRWGIDGLAFRTKDFVGAGTENQIFLLQSQLISGLASGVVTASAASFIGGRAAPESIVSAFGTGLATGTATATTTPLPTTLAGVNVKVKDVAGTERFAPLFFVSPTQINYLVPSGTAQGVANVTITNGPISTNTGTITISSVVPGLFSAAASGSGPAAAVAVRLKADGSQALEAVTRLDQTQTKPITIPIVLGPESERVFLILFGTGIRFRSNQANIIARIGCADAPLLFAGAQGSFIGVDQVNLQIPRVLLGAGEVDVALTLNGQTTNFVKVNIR